MDILKDGITAGELRADLPVKVVRDLVYGCVEHHTWAYLRGEGKLSAEESADAITDIVFEGIARPQTSRAPDLVQRLEAVATRLERAR